MWWDGFLTGLLVAALIWAAAHELDRRHCEYLSRRNGEQR